MQKIPGFDPHNQPDFAYHKPGGNDGAGLVSKVMGRLVSVLSSGLAMKSSGWGVLRGWS